MFDQTSETAFALLRPILQELKVQYLEEAPRCVKTSAFRPFIIAGMDRWVVIAQQATLQQGIIGCTSVVYDKTHNLFLLVINVNKRLFVRDELELRTQRKIVAIHEFVHGAAHMFLSSLLKPEKYIEETSRTMNTRLKMTTSNDFNAMLSAIRELGTKDEEKPEVFTDGHFRLLSDDNWRDGFKGNYVELCYNLLLSYELINETMMAFKLQHENPRGTTKIDVVKLITLTISELINKKALDKDFVLARMRQFLPAIFNKFA